MRMFHHIVHGAYAPPHFFSRNQGCWTNLRRSEGLDRDAKHWQGKVCKVFEDEAVKPGHYISSTAFLLRH